MNFNFLKTWIKSALILSLVLFLIRVIHAQNSITVIYHDQTVQVFHLDPAEIAYLENSALLIEPKDNSTPVQIPLNQIRKITFDLNSSNSDPADPKAYHLYPNPARDYFVIQSDSLQKFGVKIFSVTGRLVLSGVFASGQTISISHFHTGVYYVSVNNKFHKLIKH